MKKIVLFLLLLTATLSAYEPYHATITVSGESASVSDPNLVDLSRSLRGENIQELIPIYTPVSPVSININLRGIDTITAFPANSTTLIVEIPQANITQTFTAATRDESILLLREYLRDGGTHRRILKAYAKYSPIDPIAGNPNSLMAQMAQADYLLGRLSPLSGCSCTWDSQPVRHQFQAGVIAGRAFSDPFDTTVITLPLRYSYSPARTWAFIIDAPFSYNRNGGASSVVGSFGAGFRQPITHSWSLTPIVRLGLGGTLDLCTSGTFLSTGLTSEYQLKRMGYVFALTNYASYVTSTNLWLTGVNFNYNLHNGIFKNGLSVTSCEGYRICNRSLNWNVYVIDSFFTGNSLFMNHYDEVGVSLITTGVNRRLCYDLLSFGFSYQFGENNYRGYFLNLIYQF